MRANEHTALLTDRVLLVPYSKHHVPAYHTWMQDEAIREATASEPLTLEQEYAMQQSWRNDADKLTFIVCTPPSPGVVPEQPHVIKGGSDDAEERMFGDVNLFLGEWEGEVLNGDREPGREGAVSDGGEPASRHRVIGELELMIARREYQGKGLGRHVLLTFMWYVLSVWEAVGREYGSSDSHSGGGGLGAELFAFAAKINASNERSVRLFEGLGFAKTGTEPNYFGEWELRWLNERANREKLMSSLATEVGEPKLLDFENPPGDG